MAGKRFREDLEEIFSAAVRRVDPEAMLLSQVALKGDLLEIALPEETLSIDLAAYRRILVLGAGKATARMAKAMESILGGKISGGAISVKYGHTEKLSTIQMIEAGHPLPDENSQRAAREIARLAAEADQDTLVINLISGGGSALLCLPYADDSVQLDLAGKQATTRLLLECGAAIQEINCIRKHISGIKGGRLAELIHPAACLNLILSDVIGDRLDAIASGLTVADDTTYTDARQIMDTYRIWESVPEAVRRIITLGLTGKIAETPKQGDAALTRVRNVLIGTNRAALLAAEKKARELGYHPLVLSSRITGEAREIAKFYLGLCLDTAKYRQPAEKPACLIAGGETTVTLRGKGLGGRNQEMALSFLNELANAQAESAGITFLSAGTDGNDGPTDAAGAFADAGLLARGREKGLSIRDYLEANDSYHFFEAVGGLLVTGPTNTNVCDVQLMLIV
jgi:glycerate 2-kinase